MSGAGRPEAVRGMAPGLGAPAQAREGLGPWVSGCMSAPSILSGHISGSTTLIYSHQSSHQAATLPYPKVKPLLHLTWSRGASNVTDHVPLLKALKHFSSFAPMTPASRFPSHLIGHFVVSTHLPGLPALKNPGAAWDLACTDSLHGALTQP